VFFWVVDDEVGEGCPPPSSFRTEIRNPSCHGWLFGLWGHGWLGYEARASWGCPPTIVIPDGDPESILPWMALWLGFMGPLRCGI
jgi:hypothetical protein